MADTGIIGGTGLTSMPGLVIDRREMIKTAYGVPSGPLVHGVLDGTEVTFLPRHGRRHTIPPHRVNYRANVRALAEAGVKRVIAVAAVGGIAADCVDRSIVIPDQIIDYTYDREHTFNDGKTEHFDHIDFTYPYDEKLRKQLIDAARTAGVPCLTSGVYAATQGPRLETAAEIRRLENDGCSIVGMTGMPEAALAREAGLQYACCAVVVNRAAGKSGLDGISFEQLEANVDAGTENVQALLKHLLQSFS